MASVLLFLGYNFKEKLAEVNKHFLQSRGHKLLVAHIRYGNEKPNVIQTLVQVAIFSPSKFTDCYTFID